MKWQEAYSEQLFWLIFWLWLENFIIWYSIVNRKNLSMDMIPNKFTDLLLWIVFQIGLCMAEGLLLFNKENSFLKDMDRVNRGKVHGAVMFVACSCLTVGIALKINQKVQSSSNHFTTTHSIIGKRGGPSIDPWGTYYFNS